MKLTASLILLCSTLSAETVTKLELKIEPGARLRPMASAVIQVKVYGETVAAGSTKSGRLRKGDWNSAVFPNDGGWLSKPFRYQGTDNEPYADTVTSGFGRIFASMSSRFTIKDSLVYTAPEKPGAYRVEVWIGSVRERLEIVVADDAPAVALPAETTSFPAEASSRDPYRKLAEHWSPYVAQETWFDWRADALCRFDFDGDWDGANNWENLGKGSTQAYVYYAAIESETHWFLIYNFFHARDYSDNCVVGTCHENDNEGVVLTVRKGHGEFGHLEAMETLAHNNVYSYSSETAIRAGAHNVEGKIALYQGSHPVVFLEAGGHGALGGSDKKSFFDADAFRWKEGTGITYTYQGKADRPRYGMDREVGYELLSIHDHWWARANDRQPGNLAFSAFYDYQPLGGRPKMKSAVGGSFRGFKHGADKAKPFWGWHDMATQRRKILATGQWAADPAYGISRNLNFPPSLPVSLNYVYNPYLDIEPVQRTDTTAVVTAPAAATSPTGACTFELVVDGTAVVNVGMPPTVETLAGAPVEERSINCDGVPPTGVRFDVEKAQGRGRVHLVGPGRVEVQDSARGSAVYRFTVRWR
ncbi:MAG: hypothetical protein K2X03_16180 [Bryobacteraceae bacterium]|nr:hypothetical protein [Bryobacteraceae bacterium]